MHVRWSLHCYRKWKPIDAKKSNKDLKFVFFLTNNKKTLTNRVSNIAFSVVTLQDQSSLRLVKVSTGEFMRKNSY